MGILSSFISLPVRSRPSWMKPGGVFYFLLFFSFDKIGGTLWDNLIKGVRTMKINREKMFLSIRPWETKYDGPAIYALLDDNNGIYVGLTKNLQKRLHTHRRNLNRAINTDTPNDCIQEGNKLLDAVRSGVKFHVVVLKRIRATEATVSIMRYWERYYIKKYDGTKFYNTEPGLTASNYYEPYHIPYAYMKK